MDSDSDDQLLAGHDYEKSLKQNIQHHAAKDEATSFIESFSGKII